MSLSIYKDFYKLVEVYIEVFGWRKSSAGVRASTDIKVQEAMGMGIQKLVEKGPGNRKLLLLADGGL